jgi:hypothetical protein
MVFFAFPLVLSVIASPGLAQENGSIAGKATDASGDGPLPFANVVVLGTQLGAVTGDDGTYVIQNVPPGIHTVQASYIGYESVSKAGVAVVAGQQVTVDFKLKEEGFQEAEVLVEAEGKLIAAPERADTHHAVTAKDLRQLPVDDVNEAIALKAGVVSQGGELHFRGGRGGEVAVYVDGVPVKDPLGQTGVDVGTAALQSSEVITGGYEAEYG